MEQERISKECLGNMYKKIILQIFVFFILSSIAFADVRTDFNALENPTSTDFQRLSDPTSDDLIRVKVPKINDFEKLEFNQREDYLIKKYDQEFAKGYVDELGKVSSQINDNENNIKIINKYFAEESGIPNVDLKLGTISWDGKVLRNGETAIKLSGSNLDTLATFDSMISTDNDIILNAKNGAIITIGGENGDFPMEFEKDGDSISMKVNGKNYPIPKDSRLSISFDGLDSTIKNNGDFPMNLEVNEMIDNTGSVILKNINLAPGGEVKITRSLSDDLTKQINLPEYDIFKGSLTFDFNKITPTGEAHKELFFVESFKDDMGNYKPIKVLIDKTGFTEEILDKHKTQNFERSVFLLHPSTWGGIDETIGKTGVKLEKAFEMRSGFVGIGQVKVGTGRLNDEGKLVDGFVYQNMIDDINHESELYLRYGIGPDALVETSNGIKIQRMNFPTSEDTNVFVPFSSSLKQYTSLGESYDLSERFPYQEIVFEADINNPTKLKKYINIGALGESARIQDTNPEIFDIKDNSLKYVINSQSRIDFELGNPPTLNKKGDIDPGKVFLSFEGSLRTYDQEGREITVLGIDEIRNDKGVIIKGGELELISGPNINDIANFKVDQVGDLKFKGPLKMNIEGGIVKLEGPTETTLFVPELGKKVDITIFPPEGGIDLNAKNKQYIPVSIISDGERIVNNANFFVLKDKNEIIISGLEFIPTSELVGRYIRDNGGLFGVVLEIPHLAGSTLEKTGEFIGQAPLGFFVQFFTDIGATILKGIGGDIPSNEKVIYYFKPENKVPTQDAQAK